MNSNNQVWTYSGTIGQHEIIIETGKLAGQADGAVTVRSGDTVVLVTATSSKEPREGTDFLPLIVDYEERLYAAGKIPGSFFRREGRPSESAILLCRLADRPLRPLFPDGYRNEVQIIITALSADQENPPDILGIIGASAALTISDIPFDGPVGAVRVSLDENGGFVFNPTISETDRSVLDLRLAGTSEAISMIEARANEVDEETILAAVSAGHQAMQGIIELQNQMRAEIGKPKREYRAFLPAAEVETEVRSWLGDRLAQVMSETHDKEEREEALDTIRSEAITYFSERFEEADVKTVFQAVLKETARRSILEHNRRPDGRDSVTIRPVNCEVGLSPRAHGSGLFTRGATQVLTIATLGTIRQEQMLDGLSPHESKRYLHHYNFPPFSTGETWFLRGPKRREIGHGALAETALRPMIPPEEGFPYT
ncbi:MAG: polyribonucleotide nucleotidyltransferase, partial [Anaerolineae bacterium]